MHIIFRDCLINLDRMNHTCVYEYSTGNYGFFIYFGKEDYVVWKFDTKSAAELLSKEFISAYKVQIGEQPQNRMTTTTWSGKW